MSDNSYEREAIAEILECLNEKGEHISSWDINALIDMLADVDIEKELLDQRENQKEAEEKRKAHVKEVTSMELPLEWENAFMQDERARGFHAASIADGLVYSLSNLGRVDIEYISLITGEDCKTVISSLKGSIYQNPKTWNECFYKGWETADEYLSGNMRKKLIEAEKANREYDGYFQENIEAIRKVLPRSADARDIYVTLGSPGIPTDIIDDFINELLGNWKKYWSEYIPRPEELLTRHDEITGTWEIPYKSRASYIPKLISKYNTRRINALHIIERTRFSKFHNLPELTMLLSQVADFHKSELIDGVPIFNGYTDSLIPKTSEFEAYLREISERAEDVRSGRVDSKTDNMLKITTEQIPKQGEKPCFPR